MQKLQNVHNMQNMQNVFSLLHLLISPRLFFHPAHVFTGTLCATNTYNVQCITICNSKQIFICMHTTPNIFSILIRPHVAPCWLFSSLYLVNINSAFIMSMFSVAKLFVSVPGGCDHPQQGVKSRAGDRGVQSHNQVRPPST